ncbi:MAG: outer membrane protein assembly factor BamA [Candidatus Poribacteria bacterium]|jgi:outer membrane protein insertion porin family|nr:outer membrane protein assembly factor BamA [Candidatus Poribacteria bacterium]MDP6747126.1 outer membrane protein assembly factor BamA [Candidatus Poribacteria bacterium]MDP6996160.1 outer membrane protein assembly factor BamA [Candidatus Poribacteria bacterium]
MITIFSRTYFILFVVCLTASFVCLPLLSQEESSSSESVSQPRPSPDKTAAKDSQSETTEINPLSVQNIRFEGVTGEEALLRSIIQTAVGKEVDPDQLSKDIKNIVKDTGLFSDISVDVEPYENGGLEVVFRLTESSKIEGIEIIGNEKIRYGKIKEAINFKTGEIFTDYLAWQNRQQILKTYREKGYYLAEVTTELDPDEDSNTVILTFNIKEGKRIKIQEINFVGSKGLAQKKLARQLKNKVGKYFDENVLEEDLITLNYFYQDSGYAQSQVLGYDKHFNEDKTGLILDIKVDEGGQYSVGEYKVEIRFSEKPAFQESKIKEMMDPAEGEIFNRGKFQKSIDKITELYQEEGYLLVEIDPAPSFDEESQIVDIIFNISEGDVIIIDNIKINGLLKTKERIISRELDRLNIKTDEFFDIQKIRKARQRLFQLGSITNVDFIPSEEEGQRRDLIVNVTERDKMGMFSVGGGYGSEGGLFGMAEVSHSNVLGRAYRVHLKGEVGTRYRQTAEFRVNTPWILGTPTRLSFNLYNNRRRQYYTRSILSRYGYASWPIYERKGASVTIGRPVLNDYDLSLRFRNDKTHTEIDYLKKEDVIYDRWTRSLTFYLSKDTRDYRMSLNYPINGTYNTVSYEYSGGLLGADSQFIKYTADLSQYIKTWKNMVIALHLYGGYLQSKADENDYFLFFERYFLGGIETVRGYQDFEILPFNNGVPSLNGGDKSLYGNIEYRIPIAQQFTGVAFFDFGQVWDKPWGELRRNDLTFKTGAGFGVRMDLQGMLLRAEWGYGFHRDDGTGGRGKGEFHFTIGPSF